MPDQIENLWVMHSFWEEARMRDPPTKEELRTGSGWVRLIYPLASVAATHLRSRRFIGRRDQLQKLDAENQERHPS